MIKNSYLSIFKVFWGDMEEKKEIEEADKGSFKQDEIKNEEIKH